MNMKKIAILLVTLAAAVSAQAVEITGAHRERARKIVEQMTFDEKVAALSGKTSFSLRPNERLGIPEIRLADGPQGVRNHHPHSTLYPSGILLAATWNRDLANRYGASLGDDARARGVGIMLGPGANMYRSPLCGRNYEYMGEDPYLTSEIAADYIKGMQSKGVIATIKHFAANNQEWSRHHTSSDIDERTLHEIYFPAFRKAVQEAGVGAVMDSYNLVNGVHSTENKWLNTDILRDTWGFNGIVMSDWTSVYSTVNAAVSGLDLEMPKAVFYTGERLKKAVDDGRLSIKVIDRKVENLLATFIAFGLLDRVQKWDSIPLDYDRSRQTALDVAREGVVLLKNSGNILPLKGRTLVLGPNCDKITTGGGSGNVVPFSETPVAKALAAMSKKVVALPDSKLYLDINDNVYTDSTMAVKGYKGHYFTNQKFEGEPALVRVDPAVDFDWEYGKVADGFPDDHFSAYWTGYYRAPEDGVLKIFISGDDGYRLLINGKQVAGDWGNHSLTSREVQFDVKAGEGYDIRVDYFDNISSANIVCSLSILDSKTLERELKRADNVVYCTGFNSNLEGEGFDRPFAIPAFQERMIAEIAAKNPNLVTVINAGGGIDLSKIEPASKALLMAWYPGQEGGQAIAEILTGKLSPSGKLPISMEKKWEDNPCHDNYYVNAEPKSRECNHVEYREGIFTGYRGFDRNGVEPMYPFGYGLSYSTFEFSGLQLAKNAAGGVDVTFTVKNTGKRKASETAQVYVSDTECSVPRPEKELKGFEKVNLKPGESRTLTVTLPASAFEYYDTDTHAFRLEPGQFTVSVGPSSASRPLAASVTL